MIRALMERAKFLRESRIPPELRPLPKKRAEGLADVLPFGNPGRGKAPDDSPEEASLHEWLSSHLL